VKELAAHFPLGFACRTVLSMAEEDGTYAKAWLRRQWRRGREINSSGSKKVTGVLISVLALDDGTPSQ
jgi:hypothetical protein